MAGKLIKMPNANESFFTTRSTFRQNFGCEFCESVMRGERINYREALNTPVRLRRR